MASDTSFQLVRWPGYFADPFVLRTNGGYFAYGTDSPERPTLAETGRQFPVLFSPDLETWDFVGGALAAPKMMDSLAFWAPEVAEREGRYYMYYSAGGEAGEEHKIRVAVSEQPEGPYIGSDAPLMPKEPFTIDAHPFRDPADGKWYLFFAKDFFDAPAGTGIAVVPLASDLLSAAGEPKPVLRAQGDWQIFERNRFWYDRIWPIWNCVEGPFVVFRQGRYWMFYSGGRWEAANYGVGCAVADHVLGPYIDAHASEGPSVLTSGDGLFGPGHNSVVVGPSGGHCICFHAWDADFKVRRLHISRLNWSPSGPAVERHTLFP